MKAAGKTKMEGFALPTVLITSVLMLTVVVAAAGAVSNTRVGLDSQYYTSLASDAAEAGVVYGSTCMGVNNNGWGGSSLTPNTNCAGVAQDPNVQSAYVVRMSSYRTSFVVGPVNSTGAGINMATSIGKVELLRPNGTVWKTLTKAVQMRTGGQVATDQVVFGYIGWGWGAASGALFGALGGDGKMRMVGSNNFGQLGNGSVSSTLGPTVFNVPSASPVIRGYTSFLSGGRNVYAVLANGELWGAGANEYGQIGAGISPSTAKTVTTPARVVLPDPNESIVTVVVTGDTNYFLGSKNNIYSAGACNEGRLGNGGSAAGCSTQSAPVRVALPNPVATDLNTIPTANIVSDLYTGYVRMAGGAVYGWGYNRYGQLGGDSFGSYTTPKRIGTYGDNGQPKATQIITDGDTLYVLDNTGKVNSLGLNSYGEMGSYTSSFFMKDVADGGVCLDSGIGPNSIGLYWCNGGTNQKFDLRWWNNTIQSRSDWRCLDNYNGDGVTLGLWSCNGSGNQQFIWDQNNGSIYHPQSGKCVDNKWGDGTTLWLYECNGTAPQHFWLYNGQLTPFDMSLFSGSIMKIWTDQWSLSCLTTNGQVWSAGLNSSGAFGNGHTGNIASGATFEPALFSLPGGVTAVDIYQTGAGDSTTLNLYAIGSNGKVYGAGANGFGQLGNGTVSPYQTWPVEMSVINGSTVIAKQVQAGFGTTVIYALDGSVYTVGNNSNGQLGDGSTQSSSTPIKGQYTNILKTIRY